MKGCNSNYKAVKVENIRVKPLIYYISIKVIVCIIKNNLNKKDYDLQH